MLLRHLLDAGAIATIVELLSADLRLTHRLGFPLVRLVSRTDPAVIRPVLPLAEKLGVSMAVEVHAGMSFDHPLTAAWIKEMKEAMAALQIDPSFAERSINEGFSGGLEITVGSRTIRSPEAENFPLYADGIECRAREYRFGGVVVQPLRVWKALQKKGD